MQVKRRIADRTATWLTGSMLALLAACGGGGSPGSDLAQSPSPETVSVTTSIPSSGGTVSVESRPVLEVTSGTLMEPADITVTLQPKADAGAMASKDVRLSLPVTKIAAAAKGEFKVFFYPEPAASSQASNRARAAALESGVSVDNLYARVKVGATRELEFVLPVAWDSAKTAYAVSLETVKLTAAALQWAGTLFYEHNIAPAWEHTLDVRFSLSRKFTVDDSSVPRKMFKWTKTAAGALELAEASGPQALEGKRIPLLLVHGIKIGFDACGANEQYRDAWKAFAAHFFDDPSLNSQYDLYTFAYPTNRPIRQNGRYLAQRIQELFNDKPVVVLAHSMGGLVTRVADALYSKKGIHGDAALADIDVSRVITLNTPHHGAVLDDPARWNQWMCWGPDSVDGALDLAWDGMETAGCSNPLLCGPDGLNIGNHTGHLQKYLPYSSSFDVPGFTQGEGAVRTIAGLWHTADSLCTNTSHAWYYCYARVAQIAQSWLDERARSGGDGATFVNSQRLQVFSGGRWTDDGAAPARSRRPVFADTDHSQIHDDEGIFRSAIRPDLLDIAAETHASTIYGIDLSGNFYAVQAWQTGLDTPIGAFKTLSGFVPQYSDVARTPDGRHYATSFTSLYLLDMSANVAIPVGTGTGYADINSLGFDSGGRLFAATLSGNLLRLDRTSGTASYIGSFGGGLGSAGDLAFKDGDRLVATAFVGSSRSILVVVDANTGVATRLGGSNSDSGFQNVWSLSHVDGQLYGLAADSTGTGGTLLRFDTTTGAATTVRRLPFSPR